MALRPSSKPSACIQAFPELPAHACVRRVRCRGKASCTCTSGGTPWSSLNYTAVSGSVGWIVEECLGPITPLIKVREPLGQGPRHLACQALTASCALPIRLRHTVADSSGWSPTAREQQRGASPGRLV